MWRFMFLTFAFLAVAFYQLSGGADFQPRTPGAGSAQASTAQATPAEGGNDSAERDVARAKDRVEGLGITLASMRAPAKVPETLKPQPSDATEKAAEADTQTASTSESEAFSFATARAAAEPDAEISPEASAEVKEIAVRLPRPSQAEERRRVMGNVVNVRVGPSTGYSVLTQLERGTEVEILRDPGDGWVKLRSVESKRVGWMAERLLSAPL